jgi:hypothetical protein
MVERDGQRKIEGVRKTQTEKERERERTDKER